MNTKPKTRKKAGNKAGKGRPFLQEVAVKELMTRYEGGETLRSLAIESDVSAASLSTRFKKIRENGRGGRQEMEERIEELEVEVARLWKILQNYTLKPVLKVAKVPQQRTLE